MFKSAEFAIRRPDADMASVRHAAGDSPLVGPRGALSTLHAVWPSFPAPSVPRARLFAAALWGPGVPGDEKTDSAEEAIREAGFWPPNIAETGTSSYGLVWQETAWHALAVLGCPKPGDIHPKPFAWARLPGGAVVETPSRRRLVFTIRGDVCNVAVDFTGGDERSPSVQAARDLADMICNTRIN